MADTVFDHGPIAALVWLIVELGALNWGLTVLFDFDVVQLVAPSSEIATLVYVVVGFAGLLALLDSLGVYDLSELDS